MDAVAGAVEEARLPGSLVLTIQEALGGLLQPVAGGAPLLFLFAGFLAATLSIIGVAIALSRWIARIYRKTIGLRREQERKLRRLACGVRPEYIDQMLGEPVMESTDGAENGRRVYLMQDCFVTVYVRSDVVAAFAITVHGKRFAPRLPIPWGLSGFKGATAVRLGRSRYADLYPEPGQTFSFNGARNFGYYELFNLGNPGFYQTYGLGTNNASAVGIRLNQELPVADSVIDGPFDPASPPAGWAEFRRVCAPNTFCVIGPHQDETGLSPLGVEYDTVRVLPTWRT